MSKDAEKEQPIKGRLTIRILLGSLFFVCVVLAVGLDHGVTILVPALAIHVLYIWVNTAVSGKFQKKLLLIRLASLTYLASLFLVCVRIQIVFDGELSPIYGWECLVFSFTSGIQLSCDWFPRLLAGDFRHAASEIVSILTLFLFSISIATITSAVSIELSSHIRSRSLASLNAAAGALSSSAVILATPATWLVPLSGNLELGYFLWAFAVNLHCLTIISGRRDFYIILFELFTILLLARGE